MTRLDELAFDHTLGVAQGPEPLGGIPMDAAFDPHTAAGGGFVRYRVDGALRYGLVIPRAGGFHRGRWSASAILYEADADAPAIMPRPSTAPDPRFRMRADIMGVSVMDTAAEMMTVTASVTANSRKRRPTTPPMKSRGMSTAMSETVSERMVKPICSAPLRAASIGGSPSSM